MENLKKIGTFICIAVLFVCYVGGVGTLYYCDIESSNFFATGILALGVGFGYLAYPIVKKIFIGE